MVAYSVWVCYTRIIEFRSILPWVSRVLLHGARKNPHEFVVMANPGLNIPISSRTVQRFTILFPEVSWSDRPTKWLVNTKFQLNVSQARIESVMIA